MIAAFLRQKINLRSFHVNYRAIERIGRGNFANVYLAENLQNGKLFAIKAFQKETILSQNKGTVSLENEIKVSRQLSHPNVLRLSEVYETKNSYYMVMDMLSGGNLLDLIQNKTLNNFNVVGILKGLIQAVEYIHGLAIMHRDIKPENIMFRSGSLETEDVYLVDFGLSTYTD